MLHASLGGRKVFRENGCIYIYIKKIYIYIYISQSLHCSPETTTMLLISYTPIQNKKFEKKFLKLLPSLQCSFPSCCLTSYTFQLFFYCPRYTISSMRAAIFVCFAHCSIPGPRSGLIQHRVE